MTDLDVKEIGPVEIELDDGDIADEDGVLVISRIDNCCVMLCGRCGRALLSKGLGALVRDETDGEVPVHIVLLGEHVTLEATEPELPHSVSRREH